MYCAAVILLVQHAGIRAFQVLPEAVCYPRCVVWTSLASRAVEMPELWLCAADAEQADLAWDQTQYLVCQQPEKASTGGASALMATAQALKGQVSRWSCMAALRPTLSWDSLLVKAAKRSIRPFSTSSICCSNCCGVSPHCAAA